MWALPVKLTEVPCRSGFNSSNAAWAAIKGGVKGLLLGVAQRLKDPPPFAAFSKPACTVPDLSPREGNEGPTPTGSPANKSRGARAVCRQNATHAPLPLQKCFLSTVLQKFDRNKNLVARLNRIEQDDRLQIVAHSHAPTV